MTDAPPLALRRAAGARPIARNNRDDQDVRPLHGARQRLDQGARRHVSRAARRERRRQVDAGQMRDGLLFARQGHAPPGRDRSHGRQSARRAGARRRHGLSAFHPGAVADGGGESGGQPRRRAGGHQLAQGARPRSRPSSIACRSACRSTGRCRSLAAGEKQKLEILKLLYLDQRFLILDEPTSVLTPGEADEILGLLKDMAHRGEITALMITPQVPRGRGVLRRCQRAQARRQGRRRQGRRTHDARDGRDDDRRCRGAALRRAHAGAQERQGPRHRRPASSRTTKVAKRSPASISRSAPARSSASPGFPATGKASSSRRCPASGRSSSDRSWFATRISSRSATTSTNSRCSACRRSR